MSEKHKKLILIVVIFLIAGSIFYLQSGKSNQKTTKESGEIKNLANLMDKEEKRKIYPVAREIIEPAGFINIDKIAINELIGKKVILVDFWTYSCINCQRTLPYLTGWYEKYKDKGLEILGIHTPEFKFEQKYENVKKATEQYGIKYPIILDNSYGTWNAYENRYWPRKYIIDIDGFIVYDHIGEGAYEETEKKIQELLEERMAALNIQNSLSKEIFTPSDLVETDHSKPISPEIYFGAARNNYLGNGASGRLGIQSLSEPTGIKTNILYLSGEWNFTDEFAENKSGGAKITFRYQGKSVYFVASSQKPIKIKVFKDGAPLKNSAGRDVSRDEASQSVIEGDRLYKLIEDENYGEHTLEILIEEPGLKAFTFTFG